MNETQITAIAVLASPNMRPMIETGARLIENLLGGPFRVAGGMLGDHIYYWRCVNRLKICEKAKRRLDEARIPPQVLPAGFLVPVLDAAGDVEDESLQELWSKLIASAVTDEEARHPMFYDVLRRMSASDAQAFVSVPLQPMERFEHHLFAPADGCPPAFLRLEALGLVRVVHGSADSVPGWFFSPTAFGITFSKALDLVHQERKPRPRFVTVHVAANFRVSSGVAAE